MSDVHTQELAAKIAENERLHMKVHVMKNFLGVEIILDTKAKNELSSLCPLSAAGVDTEV